MIQVHRSESGQYVLIHPSTSTVVISDDLAGGFAAISEKVRGSRDAPAATPERAPLWRSALPWALAILLPFVWLIALHMSLGRLASELVIGMRTPPGKAQPVTRKELEDLRLEVARVEARVEEPKPSRAAASDDPDEGEDDEDLKSLRPERPKPPTPGSAADAAKAEADGKAKAEPAEAKLDVKKK